MSKPCGGLALSSLRDGSRGDRWQVKEWSQWRPILLPHEGICMKCCTASPLPHVPDSPCRQWHSQWKDTLGESLALQDWAVHGLEVR